MPEAYGWSEGLLYVYTGATAQSGQPMAYVEQTRAGMMVQWSNDPSLSGAYRDHKIGQRVDFSYRALYTFDQRVYRIFDLQTAVHIKMLHNSVNGSAGYFYFSGHLDRLDLDGSMGNPFGYTLAGHANLWSGF
jgi:hypothetical protein